MNTSGYVMQGMPNPDGHVFVNLSPASATAGTSVRNRLSSGIIATVQAAMSNGVYVVPLTELMLRYGMQDDSQLIGGRRDGTSGAMALPLLPGVVDQTPYSRALRPPTASTSVFGPGNLGNANNIPKGICIKALNMIYQPLGAALTSASVGITKTQFTPGIAPVVTDLLPKAQYGLSLAVNAQPVIVNVPLPVASQVMLTSRLAEYVIEVNMSTAIGGTVNLFGMFLDVAYNFN